MFDVRAYVRNRASAIPCAGLTSLIKAAGISVATSANNGYDHERATENCGPKNIATAKSKRRHSRSDTFSKWFLSCRAEQLGRK